MPFIITGLRGSALTSPNGGLFRTTQWRQVLRSHHAPRFRLVGSHFSRVQEVDPIVQPERSEAGQSSRCPKAESHHHHYIPFPDLDLSHLPASWRQDRVLQDIRDIAQRVVKLQVRMLSSDRPVRNPKWRKYGHQGTGFVTYDRRWGAVVHTSKHVVLDPFEAENTDVIFFCDREEKGSRHAPWSLIKGSSRRFKSVLSMDYSSFTLEQPLPEAVLERHYGKGAGVEACLIDLNDETKTTKGEGNAAKCLKRSFRVDMTFSWRVYALKRLLYRQSRDIDVIIISHPHGKPKQVSIGKMSRRHGMSLALYNAPTCPGSSGAPVIRLSDDYMHYVAAGQFVHHGYDSTDPDIATSMGSLRPPVTLPYYKALDVGRLRRAVALLYEPVLYWALYVTDVMEVEGVLFFCTDNFCYFLTLYGFFRGWGDPWTKTAFLGFLLVVLCQTSLYALRGARYALLHLLCLLHSISMHWVTWLACVIVPRDHQSLLWVAPLWLCVLWLSRSVSLARLLGLDLFTALLRSKL